MALMKAGCFKLEPYILELASASVKNDSLSFKSSASQSSPLLPDGKIKEHGEQVSASHSDGERGYFSDSDSVWDPFFAELALMDYNEIHHTDYELEVGDELSGDNHIFHPNFRSYWSVVHVQFAAKSTEASDGHSSPKLFFAELLRNYKSNEHIVVSCHFLNGPTTGCCFCDRARLITRAYRPESVKKREDNSWVAEAALAHYNQSNNGDYEIVGDPHVYFSIDRKFVAHCNFRAKETTPRDCEPELFFAEMQRVSGAKWIVTACCVIDGCKTNAGCYVCIGRRGKKIQHPVDGFCYGLTPPRHHYSS